jgi:hypothetical protein
LNKTLMRNPSLNVQKTLSVSIIFSSTKNVSLLQMSQYIYIFFFPLKKKIIIILFLQVNITKMWHLCKQDILRHPYMYMCTHKQMSIPNTHHLIGKLITRAVCLCLLYILGKGSKDWTRMIQSLDRADKLVPINDNPSSI